jgi:hypothetical protein
VWDTSYYIAPPAEVAQATEASPIHRAEAAQAREDEVPTMLLLSMKRRIFLQTGDSYPFGAGAWTHPGLRAPTPASCRTTSAPTGACHGRTPIRRCYDAWKGNIVDVPSLPGGKALRFATNYLTVSEASATRC